MRRTAFVTFTIIECIIGWAALHWLQPHLTFRFTHTDECIILGIGVVTLAVTLIFDEITDVDVTVPANFFGILLGAGLVVISEMSLSPEALHWWSVGYIAFIVLALSGFASMWVNDNR